MEWTLGFIAIIFLTVGLIGQAFQKSNFKWYAIIGIGIACWYVAERL